MGNPFRQLTDEQQAERDTIIFGGDLSKKVPHFYDGGIHHYNGLTPEKMRTLIAKGYAIPDTAQNDCPSIRECLEFCERHPGFTMHGYVISNRRDDCRVSVEGVEAPADVPMDHDAMMDFVGLFRFADEFCVGGEGEGWYAWFD